MSNTTLLSENPKWYEIIALPQLSQDDPKWLDARKNKQSSSDFAAVVPYTKEYIGHIVEMWNYEEIDEHGVVHKPFPYNDEKTSYDHSYTEYIRKKAFPYDREADGSLKFIEDEVKFKFGGAAEIGHRFENIIRNLTSQYLKRYISEVGWVEEFRVKNAGVSPDGIVHIDLNKAQGLANHFHYYPNSSPYAIENRNDMTVGAKNFEAKTIVSREMKCKVPIKYHIQVERTAYELHLKSSIYTEAQFLELCEKDWLERSGKDEEINKLDHLKYGILLFCTAADKVTFEGHTYESGETWHCWSHAFVQTKEEFILWKQYFTARINDAYGNLVRVVPVYFQLEAFWCCEIPLWSKYEEVYGPLIEREARELYRLSQTDEGKAEYARVFSEKTGEEENGTGSAVKRKKRATKPTLFTEDLSLLQTA